MTVYLAGPIDYLSRVEPGLFQGPEARHERLTLIMQDLMLDPDEIWCPPCRYVPSDPPTANIRRNMDALERSWAVVCVWDANRQASFGTPVELWARKGRQGTIVVGTLGDGLFARALEDEVIEADWADVGHALSLLRVAYDA